ncbi:hypothetical protein PSI9734_01481 [Pseudidiomarina piscicola]|uniref:Flagellar biosynthetic protein FlhB n=1 Tax=Pseudidiomarina piscicola TaxID=2614830 RepID=A0A6S6WM19_9GAMM|nr:EscU/YscU/HrcU family type III secretion system export apparatus switch protein [Pseudidiomarina piscicola]CAB0151065.1 hypothetical protein PSI9734_01481 [Pseudidiomarina piscicola]VZT40574.1 hypothetical protein PSI9734_01481 [Pseudomonas aeruginosa]
MSDSGPLNKKAVALKYQAFDPAPKVVAKGDHELAQRIIEKARAHGVFVHESEDLVMLLAKLEVGDFVPAQLWEIVAELLVWLQSVEATQKE